MECNLIFCLSPDVKELLYQIGIMSCPVEWVWRPNPYEYFRKSVIVVVGFRPSTQPTLTEDFGQMMYRVNGENYVVRAGNPAMCVPHAQRKVL